jgi:hypothetical protein
MSLTIIYIDIAYNIVTTNANIFPLLVIIIFPPTYLLRLVSYIRVNHGTVYALETESAHYFTLVVLQSLFPHL